MGAAGAIEFIASLLAIKNQAVPPTINLDQPDPECDLDYVPNIGRKGVKVNTVMSNSFAFGGSNAVLVARKVRRVTPYAYSQFSSRTRRQTSAMLGAAVCRADPASAGAFFHV
jgi:acyl transferase domain-containing protein